MREGIPTCKGSGDIDCPGEVIANPNGTGNVHRSCKNGRCDGIKHQRCGWTSKVTCSRSNNSSYGIGKVFDAELKMDSKK